MWYEPKIIIQILFLIVWAHKTFVYCSSEAQFIIHVNLLRSFFLFLFLECNWSVCSIYSFDSRFVFTMIYILCKTSRINLLVIQSNCFCDRIFKSVHFVSSIFRIPFQFDLLIIKIDLNGEVDSSCLMIEYVLDWLNDVLEDGWKVKHV